MERLERCLPPSSVFYREPDGAVGCRLGRRSCPQCLRGTVGAGRLAGTYPAAPLPACLQVYKAEDSTYWHPADEEAGPEQQQQPAEERRRGARRMQQVVTLPRVQSFEGGLVRARHFWCPPAPALQVGYPLSCPSIAERQRTPASESRGINAFSVSQGSHISLPGVTTQVGTRWQHSQGKS